MTKRTASQDNIKHGYSESNTKTGFVTMSKPKPSQQKQRTTHHDRIPEAVLHMIWHNAENTPKRGYASLMGCNGSSS